MVPSLRSPLPPPPQHPFIKIELFLVVLSYPLKNGKYFEIIIEMGWHKGLWACVYKGVEAKRVNGNA